MKHFNLLSKIVVVLFVAQLITSCDFIEASFIAKNLKQGNNKLEKLDNAEFEKYIQTEASAFHPGKSVTGVVTDFNKDFVTVDIGFKSDGIVPIAQFGVVEGKPQVTIGDEVSVYIIALENDSTPKPTAHPGSILRRTQRPPGPAPPRCTSSHRRAQGQGERQVDEGASASKDG